MQTKLTTALVVDEVQPGNRSGYFFTIQGSAWKRKVNYKIRSFKQQVVFIITEVIGTDMFWAAATTGLKPVSVLSVGIRPDAALNVSHDQRTVTPHANQLPTWWTVATVTDSELTRMTAAIRTRMFTRQFTHFTLHACLHIQRILSNRLITMR